MDVLKLIGRDSLLFSTDLENQKEYIDHEISSSRFLVIGGAGTIGSALTKELFKRSPQVLHIIDISENNLVEVVRSLRSTLGYGRGEFKTFAIDCGRVDQHSPTLSTSFDNLIEKNYIIDKS